MQAKGQLPARGGLGVGGGVLQPSMSMQYSAPAPQLEPVLQPVAEVLPQRQMRPAQTFDVGALPVAARASSGVGYPGFVGGSLALPPRTTLQAQLPPRAGSVMVPPRHAASCAGTLPEATLLSYNASASTAPLRRCVTASAVPQSVAKPQAIVPRPPPRQVASFAAYSSPPVPAPGKVVQRGLPMPVQQLQSAVPPPLRPPVQVQVAQPVPQPVAKPVAQPVPLPAAQPVVQRVAQPVQQRVVPNLMAVQQPVQVQAPQPQPVMQMALPVSAPAVVATAPAPTPVPVQLPPTIRTAAPVIHPTAVTTVGPSATSARAAIVTSAPAPLPSPQPQPMPLQMQRQVLQAQPAAAAQQAPQAAFSTFVIR